jgi:hypothetical protein
MLRDSSKKTSGFWAWQICWKTATDGGERESLRQRKNFRQRAAAALQRLIIKVQRFT